MQATPAPEGREEEVGVLHEGEIGHRECHPGDDAEVAYAAAVLEDGPHHHWGDGEGGAGCTGESVMHPLLTSSAKGAMKGDSELGICG